jgi:hypothetical protein
MILREETVVKRKSDMPFLDPEEFKPKLKEIFENVVIPQIKRANMKQTAVEWLVDKYIIVGGITKTMVKQAKEMEKEQMIEFAELHVKAALKAASEGQIKKDIYMMTEYGESMNWKESILNSYPLENIK